MAAQTNQEKKTQQGGGVENQSKKTPARLRGRQEIRTVSIITNEGYPDVAPKKRKPVKEKKKKLDVRPTKATQRGVDRRKEIRRAGKGGT